MHAIKKSYQLQKSCELLPGRLAPSCSQSTVLLELSTSSLERTKQLPSRPLAPGQISLNEKVNIKSKQDQNSISAQFRHRSTKSRGQIAVKKLQQASLCQPATQSSRQHYSLIAPKQRPIGVAHYQSVRIRKESQMGLSVGHGSEENFYELDQKTMDTEKKAS